MAGPLNFKTSQPGLGESARSGRGYGAAEYEAGIQLGINAPVAVQINGHLVAGRQRNGMLPGDIQIGVQPGKIVGQDQVFRMRLKGNDLVTEIVIAHNEYGPAQDLSLPR